LTIADEVITNIRDTNNTCDYLIVTPADFVDGAVRLAKHRNEYPHDYVEKAHVVHLDSIYSEFTPTDTLPKHEIIWYGLKWMYENWEESFEYLVLMGDDSLVIDTPTVTVASFGRMPTFIERVINNNGIFLLYFSDDFYTTLTNDVPTVLHDKLFSVPVAIGRIPCETALHCDAYVSKIINFDLHAPKGEWRNRVLLCADDAIQANGPDYVRHWESTEKIINDYVTDYFPSKCYLSFFPNDNNGHKPEATNYLFNTINSGSLWTIFYGNGNKVAIADEEKLLSVDMISRFDNVSKPTILFSFTRSNGAYHLPYKESMCKQFLLMAEGGCLMYIACPTISFSSVNQLFGSEIFTVVKNNPQWSIGKTLYTATKVTVQKDVFPRYAVLGDPAITLSKQIQTLRVIVNETNNLPPSISCTVLSVTPFHGNYYSTFSIQTMDTINEGPINVIYKKDSVINTVEDTFTISYDVPVPNAISAHDLKFIAYVWDSLSEARADTIILSSSNNIMNDLLYMENKITLLLHNGRLRVNYIANSNNKISKLEIFNTHGQNIFTLPEQPNTCQITVDLNQKNISPGCYLVRICTTDKRFTKQVLYVK
jgi:hypothetical protein